MADDCYDAMKLQIAQVSRRSRLRQGNTRLASRCKWLDSAPSSAAANAQSRANGDVEPLNPENRHARHGPKVKDMLGRGECLPVSGRYTQAAGMPKYLTEAFCLTKEQLVPGKIGREIDAPARKYFSKHALSKYLVCPFAHTIGLHEAESPFFGPNSDDVLKPGMTVSVDVSFFGHPEFYGVRIETGYEITDKGLVPMSPKMDRVLCGGAE